MTKQATKQDGGETVAKAIGDLATVLSNRLESPNEMDSNGENANVVDGLYAIARALRTVAAAIDKHGQVR